MRKKHISLTAVILIFVIILGTLSGCGKFSASDSYESSTPMDYAPKNEYDMPAEKPADADNGTDFSLSDATASRHSDLAEKIIYSSMVEVETTDFEGALEALYKLLSDYGGFIESSYITGNDYRSAYYGYQNYRCAEFVMRVPVSNYRDMTGSLSSVGNVTSTRENVENITSRFYDAEARLNVYKAEEARLIEMMGKAGTVSEMIEVEARLAEVRYEIESLETTLRAWQNEVDYSTVEVYLQEVEELSRRVETQRSFWQETWDGFLSTLRGIGRFFKELFQGFVAVLPVLIILAVLTAALIIIIRNSVKRRRAKRINAVQTQNKQDV